MKIILIPLIVIVIVFSVAAQDSTKTVDTLSINYRYKQIYDFVTMPDTIYTFEGEFSVPDGYRHADSTELTPFQNYVANFPIWHRFMPVGSIFGKRVYEYTEISRPVHLPYSGPAFTDKAAPIRILAEFLHDHNRELDILVIPNAGDTMTYDKWLFNSITYLAPGNKVLFKPSTPKDTTLKEYYTFMRFCLENTSYKSLAYNCDSVSEKDLKPGDLFVAHSEDGKKGKVYVVMHMLTHTSDEKLYAVATGCEKACDFHIPLFNNDKNNPWISAKDIEELGVDFPQKGFLRLKFH